MAFLSNWVAVQHSQLSLGCIVVAPYLCGWQPKTVGWQGSAPLPDWVALDMTNLTSSALGRILMSMRVSVLRNNVVYVAK